MPLDRVPVERVLALMKLALGTGSLPRTAEVWEWKHRASPAGPSPGLAAVADDGTLIGLRVFQRWRLRAGGVDVPAVRAVDTATHPDWRRRGVFRRLTLELVREVRDRGSALVFNTPNRLSGLGYRALGWHDLGRTRLRARPLRPWRTARGLLAERRRSEPEPTLARPPGTEPIEALLGEPRLESFLTACFAAEARLHTVRDVPYLSWRYQPPIGPPNGGGYGALWHFAADGTGALIVARARRRRGLAEVTVCEVLTAGGASSTAAARLLGTISAACRSGAAETGGDYLVAGAARGTPEDAALAAAGFLPAGRRGPRLMVRPLATDLAAQVFDGGRGWRLAAGDLELF